MKIEQLFENEFVQRDKSTLAKMATQISSQAATQFPGPKAKDAATAAANRMHTIILKNIDDYFANLHLKEV